MKLRFLFTIALCIFSLSFAQDAVRPVIMVHYMPWFQTKAVHGSWGWHWTMNHYDPDVIDQNGERAIASHYYPLTGPYDSEDKNILEYQTLLMKIAGIDGALVDWYGKDSYFDYGVLNASTQAIFKSLQQAQLLFGIVYEDQSVKHIVDGGYVTSGNALDYGKSVMDYAQNNWYGQTNYLRLNNHPVILTFGPQYFVNSSDWDTLFSVLRTFPLFFTLDNRLTPVAAGAFPWPPMWKSDASGVLTQDLLNSYLNQFYGQAASWPYLVTSAFPGFYDIYKEAGVGPSYGYLDRDSGFTFTSTLRQALLHHPNVIQIATWNDYGEGTIIEPTEEFGYQYLEIVQGIRDSLDAEFQFQQDDLQLPLRIYNARVQFSGNDGVNSALDRIFNLIITSQRTLALQVMDSLSTAAGVEPVENKVPYTFGLQQNYPNPFNPSTVIRYQLPKDERVSLKIYNTLGERVATLVDEKKSAGTYHVEWNPQLPSGVYYYRLNAGEFAATKKLILLK